MDRTKIEWLRGADGQPGATWNPIMGCLPVGEGCRNCFAARVAARFSGPGLPFEGVAKMVDGRPTWTGVVRTVPKHFWKPFEWSRSRRILVASTSDPFHEHLAEEVIDRIFAMMLLAKQHAFILLTKRATRMRDYMNDPKAPERVHEVLQELVKEAGERYGRLPEVGELLWPPKNLVLGVSVEDQKSAAERIRPLLETWAACRVISMEPLIEGVDLRRIPLGGMTRLDCLNGELHIMRGIRPVQKLDWVIVGGESGPGARPLHPDWVRAVRDACDKSGVAFFFKQWGEWWANEPEPGEAYCCVCGCTEDSACEGGCHWVETDDMEDRCSECVGLPKPKDRALQFFKVGKEKTGHALDDQEYRAFPPHFEGFLVPLP